MKTKPVIPADLNYDPYDAEIDKDPYKVWKRLRDEAPLYYNEQHDFYALSRFDDVYQALRNWRDYSSAHGTVLEIIKMDLEAEKSMFGDANIGLMIFTDPPAHDIARKLVSQYFTPTAVSAFEQRSRTLVRHFLDKVEGQSSFDVVEEVIRPIPPMMIGHILGVPEADQEYLGRLVDQSLAYDPEAEPIEFEEGMKKSEMQRLIGGYLAELVEKRTSEPRDDLLSMLVGAEVKQPDGSVRNLGLHEVISFFMLLQSAGSETTARALSWAAVLLARHPEQRKKLVEDPSRINNAIEELLRYEAPSPIQARYVMRDVEWHGVTVPQGSRIALLNGSAGRDERQYPDPESFDVERRVERHLTFGFGTHVCLGASLARLEMRVVLEELLKRYPEWHVDESQVELVYTTTVRGPSSVTIQVA